MPAMRCLARIVSSEHPAALSEVDFHSHADALLERIEDGLGVLEDATDDFDCINSVCECASEEARAPAAARLKSA